MTDLSSFDTTKLADDGAVMVLCDPIDGRELTDEESGEAVTLTLIGQDAKEYQREVHKATNKRLNKRVTKGRIKLSAEEIEGDSLELLIKCTKSWAHITVDGESLEFAQKNVRMLYERFPWIREQVDEFTTDRSNFLGNSSTNSSTSPSVSSKSKGQVAAVQQ